MNVFKLAWRYLTNRPLVSLLTIIGVALGAGLISSVLTLRAETRRTFLEAGHSFDLVVGAKGSPLQMVLSSLYHMDVPTGNIPYDLYEEVKDDFRVSAAVPIGLGDNYKGFRLVGTNNDMFAMMHNELDEEPYPLFEIDEGRMNFEGDTDAILGYEVSRLTGLDIGDTFYGTHGVVSLAGSEDHDNITYEVVGILESSGTPNDRAIFIPIEAVWAVHDYEEEVHNELFGTGETEEAEEEETEEEPTWAFAPKPRESKKEVTAILIQLEAVGTRFQLLEEINEDTDGMGAVPIQEMMRLYTQILAPVQKSLLAVAYLVVVVATLSVLTSLYQAGERRRRDIAVMRSLGAYPREIFFVVMIESMMITLGGVLLGALLGHGALAIVRDQLFLQAGLSLRPWSISVEEIKALSVVIAAGLVAGLIPSIIAYRSTPVKDLQLNN